MCSLTKNLGRSLHKYQTCLNTASVQPCMILPDSETEDEDEEKAKIMEMQTVAVEGECRMFKLTLTG